MAFPTVVSVEYAAIKWRNAQNLPIIQINIDAPISTIPATSDIVNWFNNHTFEITVQCTENFLYSYGLNIQHSSLISDSGNFRIYTNTTWEMNSAYRSSPYVSLQIVSGTSSSGAGLYYGQYQAGITQSGGYSYMYIFVYNGEIQRNSGLRLIRTNVPLIDVGDRIPTEIAKLGTVATGNYLDSIKEDIIVSYSPTPPEGDDPYNPGGESEEGGGGGDWDDSSDQIPTPGLPDKSAVDTGFMTIFNPSEAQLQSLASYMWSGGFDLDTFKKLFADPMDAILGLSLVPVDIPTSGNAEVKVGNIGTGITMPKASTQFVAVNCGYIDIQEHWGAYLDYNPYTKCNIFLPFIGMKELSIDDVMKSRVKLTYHVDILSGACSAYIQCTDQSGNSKREHDAVLYTFMGQCGMTLPISGKDYTQMLNGVLGAVSSTVGAIGGISSPFNAAVDVASLAVNSFKQNIERSGNVSGAGSLLGFPIKPYLVLERPYQCLPRKQNSLIGYPSFVTKELSSLSGFNVVHAIHLENISATDTELQEIYSLLEEGVIF